MAMVPGATDEDCHGFIKPRNDDKIKYYSYLCEKERERNGNKIQNISLGGDDIGIVSCSAIEMRISTYYDTNGYTIAMAADPTKEIYYRYATMYVPRCYLIDSYGIIKFTTYEYTEGDVERIIDEYNNL